MSAPGPSSANLVDHLLAYVDKPWKVAAVILLGLFGLLGYIIFLQRATIAEVILHGYVKPALKIETFDKDALGLLASWHADRVTLLSARIESNTATVVASFSPRGADLRLQSPDRAMIRETTSPALIIKFIEGAVICFDISPDSPVLERREEADEGLKRGCVVAVPPVLDVLTGALYVAWKEPLPPAEEHAAMPAIHAAAMRFATW